MIYAGILAGGIGSRMNSNIPKQFMCIDDIPIVIITLKKFLSIEKFDKVLIAINSEWKELLIKILNEHNLDLDRVIIIDGGNTRFESLINLATETNYLSNDEKTVLVTHDCARPFVSSEIIINNLSDLKNYDAVTTSISAIDTILVSKDGKISNEVPQRSNLFLDQGPQTFYVKQFLNLVKELTEEKLEKYMEIGKLYIDNNLKVGIVQGIRENFKITNTIDLEYANFLVKRGFIK